MNLQAAKTAVTSKVGRQILIGKKHSPTILFAGGVVGVVTTTVLACKATLKLEEVLDETREVQQKIREANLDGYSEEDRKKDMTLSTVQGAVKVAKLYAPAAAVGVVSIAALTGSHVVMNRRNTALMAAYSALDRGFNQYRQRVRDELGDEKDRDFRYGSGETKKVEFVDDEGKKHKFDAVDISHETPSMYARFFDETSREWNRTLEYNRIFLNCQQNYANDLLQARGHVFLNEVYDRLGFERTKAGAVVGWVKDGDGDGFIDFGIFDGDSPRKRMFVNGDERSILLDFNVDGVIYDKLGD